MGKIVAERFVGKDVVCTHMVKLWKLDGDVRFSELGDNLFLLEFSVERDKQRVKAGRPWLFDQDLFVLVDFDGAAPVSLMDFGKASFWV